MEFGKTIGTAIGAGMTLDLLSRINKKKKRKCRVMKLY
jgi:hypothetical protein